MRKQTKNEGLEINRFDNIDILDVCCGGRMFWFEKNHPNTIYIDKRIAKKGHVTKPYNPNHEVIPNILMDFRQLGFRDNTFKLIIFDPPHLCCESKKSALIKKFGALDKENWRADLSLGFKECWRVLKDGGILIFKWGDTQISLQEVLSCFDYSPLIGHRRGRSIWCTFYKNGSTKCLDKQELKLAL